MTPNILDQARTHIQEALVNHDGIVDASAVAAAVKGLFPHVDLGILTNAIIEETIAAGGSVAWAGPVAMNQNFSDPQQVIRPVCGAHVLIFRAQAFLGMDKNNYSFPVSAPTCLS
ncbi:MAG: hypothetical protein U1E67_00715 [Hyphomicrobiales bacterium]